MGGFGDTLKLLFTIEGNPEKAEAAMGRLNASSVAASTNVSSVWSGAMSAITGPTGIALGLFTALGGSMVGLAEKAANAGSKIFEASEKTGMSAPALSGMMALCEETGKSFDALSASFARGSINIAKAADTGKGALAKLFSEAELQSLKLQPVDEQMHVVLQRIFALSNEGERNIALQALMGRGWQQNVEVLKMLAEEGFGPAIERAKQLGVYFDAEHAAQARQFTVEWEMMKAELSGVALVIGMQLIPAFNRLFMAMDAITQSKSLGFWEGAAQKWRDLAGGVLYYVGTAHNVLTEALLGERSILLNWGDALVNNTKLTQSMTDELIRHQHMIDMVAGGGDKYAGTLQKIAAATAYATQHHVSLTAALYDLAHGAKATADSTGDSGGGGTPGGGKPLGTAIREMDITLPPTIEHLRQLTAQVSALVHEANTWAAIPNLDLMKKMGYGPTLAALSAQDNPFGIMDIGVRKLSQDVIGLLVPSIQAGASAVNGQVASERELAFIGRELHVLFPQMSNDQVAAKAAELGHNTALLQQIVHLAELTKGTKLYRQEMQLLIQTIREDVQGEKSLIQIEQQRLPPLLQLHQSMTDMADATMKSALAAAIYGENVGKAMEKAAKAAISSIAEQAGVQALNALAQGLWLLAQAIWTGDAAMAAAAAVDFEAAAEWGAIAGVAGAAAAAIPSGASRGRGGAGRYSAGGYGGGGGGPNLGGYGLAPGAASALNPPGGQLTVMVVGEAQAGRWLATTLNTAVQRGVSLNATTVQKSPYAGG